MSITAETYYDLLCVSPTATTAELKVAYRRLIRTFHPDIAGVHGEAMTKRINSAYSELSDPSKRSSYDFSIRPEASKPAFTEPTVSEPAFAEPTAEPRDRQRERQQERKASNAPKPVFVEEEAVEAVSSLSARAWLITWGILFTVLVVTFILMNIEWLNPTELASKWTFITGLVIPVSIFAFLTRRPGRTKTAIFLWFAALILPFGALGWWPFASIFAGLSIMSMVTMSVLVPLIYVTRWAWKNMRAAYAD